MTGSICWVIRKGEAGEWRQTEGQNASLQSQGQSRHPHCLSSPPSHASSVPAHLLAESLVPAGLSQDLPPHPFSSCQTPCQQDCTQALQPEPGIVFGDVAGLFAPKPSEKSQQSMANNTQPAAAASIFSPKGWRPAGRQVGSWKEAGERLRPSVWGLGLNRG